MIVKSVVLPSCYQDSVVLMRLAETLRARPGVREAAALMGTPANHDLLASAGLSTPEAKSAGPGDLIVAVAAGDEAVAEAALAAAREALAARRPALGSPEAFRPRTLESALRQRPDANLVVISVPGAYAAFEAMQALRRGLHVFLFSDHVPLADEVALKREALRRRLLCMGPDCGTAYLNGIGLGFANVVPRGRIGCVSASGTGLQAVASGIAALGEGLSHGIGVGGRDLDAEVGGAMTVLGLEALAADAGTEVIVLISKPPAPAVLPRLEAALAAMVKPVIAGCLGARPVVRGGARWVATLEDAAVAAVATLRGEGWTPRAFSDPKAVRQRLARAAAGAGRRGAGLLGLFTGGTLAHEARLLLEPLIGPVASNLGPGGEGSPHRILDLGSDEFTAGRPHPMLDPSGRAARVREAGGSAAVGVLLVDLVLGRGTHPDPAGPLAAAIREARAAAAADGRSLAVVASVVGTAADPQGLAGQVAALEAAGAEVLPSNAQAARFAALLLRPEAAAALLAGA
jgi:FdrA protein